LTSDRPESVDVVLSPEGQTRKVAMLRRLDGTMRRRNTRRAAGRVALPFLLIAGVPAAAWFAIPSPPGATWPSGPTVTTHPAVPRPALVIVQVATDASILDRLAAPTPTAVIREIDDRQLQAVLESRGEGAGLIRTGGRVMLASDIVPPEPPNTSDSSG
jgi:hypothetical protein